MTACADTCTRIRVALAEQDLEDAERRIAAAHEAIHAAEDELRGAHIDLHLAQQAAWLRRAELRRARRALAA